MLSTEEFQKQCDALLTIGQAIALAPQSTISADTFKVFDQKALGLLNLIDVK